MKAKLLIIASCLGILMSGQSVNAYCRQNPCDSRTQCSRCDCTDYGYYYNHCMSKSRYCHVFGNAGGR